MAVVERKFTDPLNKSHDTVIPTGEVFVVHTKVQGTAAATATNYGVFFIAPAKCEVIQIQEIHDVVGSDGSPVTLNVERLQGTEAADAGDALLTDNTNAGVSLKATARTVQTGTLVTDSTCVPSAGNRLCLKDAGTMTAVNDVAVAVYMKWVTQ